MTVDSMYNRKIQKVWQWAVCAGDEWKGYERGHYVQERCAEAVIIGSMECRGYDKLRCVQERNVEGMTYVINQIWWWPYLVKDISQHHLLACWCSGAGQGALPLRIEVWQERIIVSRSSYFCWRVVRALFIVNDDWSTSMDNMIDNEVKLWDMFFGGRLIKYFSTVSYFHCTFLCEIVTRGTLHPLHHGFTIPISSSL